VIIKPIFEYDIADILPNNRYFIRLLLVYSLPALIRPSVIMDELAIQLRNQQDLASARNTALLAKKAAQPKNTSWGYTPKRAQFAVGIS
jgi:hypothetical protein